MSWSCFVAGIAIFLLTVDMASATDMFSSIAELERLHEGEQQVAHKLEQYLNLVKKQTDVVERYLAELRDLRSSNGGSTKVITNPINAFHMMKRLTIVWQEIKGALQTQANVTKIVKEVMKISESFPNDEDLSGAAFSFAVLQGAYRLNVSQLARGYVQMSDGISFASVKGLDARDCLFIGKHAFNKGFYDQAVEWISTAAEVARSEDLPTATISEIEPFLSTAIRVHDDVLEKKGPFGENWRTSSKPFDQRRVNSLYGAGRSPKQTKRMTDTLLGPYGLATRGTPDWVELEVFSKLCRGERLRPAFVDRDLKCYRISHTHPYFTLRPLKLEEHSRSPYVAAFHDFMSDSEMDVFKSLAFPLLHRSAHNSKWSGPSGTTSDRRTSKQAWVEDGHPVVDKITKRISDSVGLNSQPYNVGSEPYQVANYGIGGRYTPHADHGILGKPGMEPPEFEAFRGDRILTFMTYLDDVEAGGATVFTQAGVTVWPKKGMAVFWWNLLSDLNGDMTTRHGGCPVLHGSKWICNKWFRSNEQMTKKPCAKHPGSPIRYPGSHQLES